MRTRAELIVVFAVLNQFVTLLPGQAQSDSRIQLRKLSGGASPVPLEKEPGDEVSVRPDGAIVAASRGRAFAYSATNQVEIKATVSYSVIAGRLQYRLQLANGSGALKSIGLIRIGMSPPSDLALPFHWKVIPNPASLEPQLGLVRIAPDDSQDGRLVPGSTLGPVTFSSDRAPGLVDVIVYPEPDLGIAAPGELTNGEFFNRSSPWVQQQISQLDTPERHLVHVAIIGPATPLANDSTLLIATELTNAVAQRPELAHLQGGLQVPLPLQKTELVDRISKMRQGARAGIATEFLDALSWRLQQLR